VLDLLEPWVHFGDAPLIVRTSGSTGEPKDVVLSHAAVLASARSSLARLGGPGEWLLALPVTGVAGLQVLVRSILSGTKPIIASDHPDLTSALEAFAATTSGPRRRYTSLVPTQVHRLAEHNQLGLLAQFDAVLVGGAAMPVELRDRAAAAGVPVVRTYGMTETCGGCVYDGVPLDGVGLRVDEDGQVWISGPTLFDGYGDEPFTAEWFPTADLGALTDGVLRIDGRLDEVAVSGGVNVSMPAVERALRSSDLVAEASVFGVDDPEWGTRVVAAIVPREGPPTDADALRRSVVSAGLPRAWVPRQIMFVREIPLLPSGKVDRQRLREMVVDP
jgi:O-succinylbenzoic acid--CoA ligase